ncbi:MAG: carbohydrate ABC transporter permease [Spirochaetes bacterium]|nr:carbohydrate ABC transporter permease [Spirochaetota bacterium]
MGKGRWYYKVSSFSKGFLFFLLVLFILVPVVFPFLWMLDASFKTQKDITSIPPKFLISRTLENYRRVFQEQNFLRFFFNSAVVGVSATLISLALGLPAAYSIARYKQETYRFIILVARLMPGISLLLPWYLMFSRLGLIDTFLALILSHILIGLPIVVWTMSSYFQSVPLEIEESALVDGVTRQRIFVSIVLPISTPGIVTATTLSFLFSWNNFMFSQVLSMENTKTLPLAVYNFVSYAEVDWGSVMAASIAIITPAIILTMIFQQYVVKGLTVGALKG